MSKFSPIQRIVYTVPELVATGLFSSSAFYRELAAGHIRAVKQGRRTVVMAEEVERYRSSLPPWAPRAVA